MSEIHRILDLLDRAHEGNAWHGPPVSELLKGVSARQAATKSVPAGHSIWEIVLHITAWQDVARRRLAGEVVNDLPPQLDWPPVPDTSDTAWLQEVENLTQSKQQLREAISQLGDQRLDDQIPGKDYSVYVLLHGVVQHNLYHAGQIAVLKKSPSGGMKDFQSLFGRLPTVTAQAPGRVNLIGEHTDYNGGFVLPTAIPQLTQVELAPRDDQTVRVWSSAMVAHVQPKRPTQVHISIIHSYRLGGESRKDDWIDFIQGITSLLLKEGFSLQGFNARIDSNIPLGSGLSSSASLTVAFMRALRSGFNLNLDDVSIARLGQRVENEFVGARVGIMDPMAASLADQGTALFLDCRSLQFQRVPLPAEMDFVVLNSGIAHQHAAGDYNTRRSECEKACALLRVHQLRDLTIGDLDRISALPEPLCRRARHVVTENERVTQAVAAIKAGDLTKLGELFYASHASMRDDYQVSIPEIDLIVELARSDADVYGARLTGGGFGGSVVMLAHAGAGRTVAERIAPAYAKRSGQQPKILVPT